jgi:hypothetical protein
MSPYPVIVTCHTMIAARAMMKPMRSFNYRNIISGVVHELMLSYDSLRVCVSSIRSEMRLPIRLGTWCKMQLVINISMSSNSGEGVIKQTDLQSRQRRMRRRYI